MKIIAALAAASLLGAASAMAVGLGPLEKSGVTDGAGKAFYLTLINPSPRAEQFTLEPHALLDEQPAPRVVIFPAAAMVAPGGRRQVLVIVRRLAPGETYMFRVCAQRPPRLEESVHARVCSKLTARRLPARDQRPESRPGRLPSGPA